jgi:hypothetical protein
MPFPAFPSVTRQLASVLAFAALAGCASMSANPEAVVRVRAGETAKARIANDFDSVYQFTAPSFRAVTPLNGYKNTFVGPVQWSAAEVESVQCETQDKCVAKMKVQAKPLVRLGSRQAPSITSYFDETWIRENGQWWLFPTP